MARDELTGTAGKRSGPAFSRQSLLGWACLCAAAVLTFVAVAFAAAWTFLNYGAACYDVAPAADRRAGTWRLVLIASAASAVWLVAVVRRRPSVRGWTALAGALATAPGWW